jgi:3-methyladenine DNA glycosylase AlkD
MTSEEIILQLEALGNPEAVAGMARFGIKADHTLGISMEELRRLAKRVGRNHALAGELWASGIHEARILACLVDEPRLVTEEQMERWVGDFDSWDVCDQCCANLFDRTEIAFGKAAEWSGRSEEFVKRAGFALMAALAWHDKAAADEKFEALLPLIKSGAVDDRNFVKKAVNWALRQIGKRNPRLNALAIETAKEIQALDSRAARWVAADALRELSGPAVQKRLSAS